jgi:hypothetical protein
MRGREWLKALCGLEPAGPEVSVISLDETGLLRGASAAATEDRDALGIGRLDPTGIDEYGQLADFAAVMGPSPTLILPIPLVLNPSANGLV